ncbi:MAG TPA: glycoside hydrolase family 3 N-terminal domain-containing protein, partial [Thermoanaerobaculia bacterium]|nr:glycoside hydrolase family 3 N-terminal domain-containing protein [Thermoanaerobaculia bacterium]
MQTIGIVMTLLISATSLLAQPLRDPGRADERWVEQTLRRMSLEQKAGQMLVPYFRGTYKPEDGEEWQQLRSWITELHLGGLHTFGGDPNAVALMLSKLQGLARIPLMITADLEGGVGYVFPGATRLPLAMAIGATGDPEWAEKAGAIAATEGRTIGIHVNFYPVVDVNNNPRNPIINIRSFGEDVDAVSAMARAYVRGAQRSGQIATAKHFPGHGDVAEDSHLMLPVLELDRARLDRVELPPFQAAIDEGVGAVMTAHIWMKAFDREQIPATLSRNVLTTLLRDEMGFRGLLFTDAMDMHGVTLHYELGDATVRAVEAGADVVLFPPNPAVSHAAIVDAVRSGRIPESRLDDAVRHILRAKARLGIHRGARPDPLAVGGIVGARANREVAQQMMDQAVTLVRDEKNVVPLRPSADLAVLHVNLLDRAAGWREGPVGHTFAAELKERFPRTTTIQIDDSTTPDAMTMARRMSELADAVVVSAFIRVGAYKGSIDLTDAQTALLRELSAMDKPFVFSLFGSPYVLPSIPELPSYILGYDTHPAAEISAVRGITGEMEFRG